MRCRLATLLIAALSPLATLAGPAVYGKIDALAVVDAIEARLALMPDVARFKHRHQRPIEDRERERAVMAAAMQSAARAGIDPDSVRALFHAQIEAAKDIQRRTLPPADDAKIPDLETELRPALSAIGERLIRALSVALPDLGGLRGHAEMRLTAAGLDPKRAQEIAAALGEVRALPVAAGRVLDRVLARGVLKVGTTGDYPPFSERTERGFAGIDIDLARDLARELGVELVLVPTTWPELMADLEADRFDIAMSGISRTLTRARAALFSAPYHRGGKIPVARCSDTASYATLEAIDRPGVVVLVNPGGTNERFARAQLGAATIVVVEDNLDIFRQLAAGQGDVMITDQIEVAVQSVRHPELCATRKTPFAVQTKGFMLPRDPIWQHYVDLWLERLGSEGRLAPIFNRCLRSGP